MIFAADLGSPEAPVLLPDGSLLVVEMSPDRGWVARIIAFDASGALYVNETVTGMIYRYRLSGPTTFRREELGNVNDPSLPPGWHGPDGMKFGLDGRWYVAVYNQGDVTVLGPDGAVADRL